MDINSLIQSELTRIEEEAISKTKQFLEATEAFIAAHRLTALLKQHGADNDLQVTPIYYGESVGMLLYPAGDSTRTASAIKSAGIEIEAVMPGYSDEVTQLKLREYKAVKVFVDRSTMDWQAET